MFNSILHPMLLSEAFSPFDHKDYLFEVKYDGIRAILFVSPTTIRIESRKGVDLTSKFPELKRIKELVKEEVILDGEIIALQDGKPNFKKVMERVNSKTLSKINRGRDENPVLFMAFDILYKKHSLVDLPLIRRKRILEKMRENESIMIVPYIEKKGKALFKQVKKQSLEGIVAKEKNSLYEVGVRTDKWIKIKNRQEGVFLILDCLENANETVSLLLGENRSGKIISCGKVLLGKNQEILRKVKEAPKASLKCLITYLERSENGSLRHPHFVKLT